MRMENEGEISFFHGSLQKMPVGGRRKGGGEKMKEEFFAFSPIASRLPPSVFYPLRNSPIENRLVAEMACLSFSNGSSGSLLPSSEANDLSRVHHSSSRDRMDRPAAYGRCLIWRWWRTHRN